MQVPSLHRPPFLALLPLPLLSSLLTHAALAIILARNWQNLADIGPAKAAACIICISISLPAPLLVLSQSLSSSPRVMSAVHSVFTVLGFALMILAGIVLWL